MTVKAQKPIVIFRGDNTAAFDLRTITILLTGDLDLSHATAKFTLLDFSKTWTEQEVATGELSVVFTAEQTKAFALGPQTGTLRLYDMSTGTPRQLTVVNKIPFFVTNRVCEIDSQSYEADVCVSGGDVIHIEFKVGAGAVEGKADKVKNATAGDLASLTADGNLEDSGIPKTDVLRKSQMDSTPTLGSQNPVTSDGIKQALDAATPSDYAQVKAQVEQNTGDIADIKEVIPNQASAQNKLADKAFVNSSIATNTATFRGSYNLVSDLGLTVSATEQQVAAAIATKLASLVPPVVPENNDYCFVQVPKTDADPTVIVRVDRYKCTVTESGGVTTRVWDYEWSLNNSSFTAEQWAAINSGITSGLVEKLNGIEAGAQVNTVTSVNSKTGAVSLTASDVGAVPLDGTAPMTGALDTPGVYIAGSSKRFQISEFLGRLTILNATDGGVVTIPNVATSDILALLSDIYAAVQQIAPAWVSGTSYDATAKVSYNGVVYARKTSGTITSSTNPASDTTNWEAKKVSELFAPLASPAFTGTPTAPTPTAGDNSTKVATTAFVKAALPYAIATAENFAQYFVMADRTVNKVDVGDYNAIILRLPTSNPQKSRDFVAAVTCGSGTPPTLSVESATLINTKGEPNISLTLEANATTVLRFTEVANGTTSPAANPVFVVTGGANGGGSVDPATLNTKANSTALAPNWRAGGVDTAYAVNYCITYNGNAYVCMVAYTATSSSPTPDQDIYDDSTTPATGHWKLTDMTTPDATLDVTSQGSLRVVSAGGQTLWQQGYKLASASSATLSNEGVNIFTFAAVTAFDDTASYAIGDTVAYDGKAYTFTSSHSGAWTGNDVELAAQSFSLPAAPTGKVGDFILEIDNTANASVAVAIDIAEYTNTTISLVIPDGAAIDDMTVIGGGVRCEFYFTQTAFNVNSKPTWKVVRQDVEVVAS